MVLTGGHFMESINLTAVLLAAVGQFAFGALWYTALFGNLWGKMHGFDKLPKAKQQEMMKGMNGIYAIQFLVTLISVFVLAKLITLLPSYSAYTLAFWFWLGFMVPCNVSTVLFGGTENKWIPTKIALMCGAHLGYLVVAVFILGLF